MLAFSTKNLGLHSLVKDSRQLSKDLIHLKLVQLKLLHKFFSPHSLLHSFTQADSIMRSEQVSAKGHTGITNILPPTTSTGARAYDFNSFRISP